MASGCALRAARALTAALCVALAGCEPGGPGPAAGVPMPDLDLVGLEGGPQRWSPRSGRVVVINFWATWCAPCRREMDSLERLAALGEAAGIEVVGVSVDDDPNLVREHVRRNGWAFARFIDHGRVASRGRLGIQALPRTYVVGPDGRIALVVDGPRDWTDAGMLARLMAMRARPGLAGY